MEMTPVRNADVLAQVELLICNTVPASESKRAYRKALRELIDWCEKRHETQLTKAVISRYRSYLVSRNLAPAAINEKLSAIRAAAIELKENGILSPAVSAAIAQIPGVKGHGLRPGRWLGHDDAQRLLNAPDSKTLKGMRDRALIAVMLGCGLCTNEVVNLMAESIRKRSGKSLLVDIRGKHGHLRTILMAGWVKDLINDWLLATWIESGRVFCAINKADRICGDQITAQTVYDIITGYGVEIGLKLSPHDLRRSFARLAHSGKSPLEQIQLSLGHVSAATTERYIGPRQNLTEETCHRPGFVLPSGPELSSDSLSIVLEPQPDASLPFDEIPIRPLVTTRIATSFVVVLVPFHAVTDSDCGVCF